MRTKILGLLLAAALATAACHQEDEKVEATAAMPTKNANIALVPDTMAAYDDARRLAARLAQDMKLTDARVVKRIEKTYYARGRRMAVLQTRYANDTTGRYKAMRRTNDQADEEVRKTLNNPAAYKVYAVNRAAYGEGPYSLPTPVAPVRTLPTAARAKPAARRVDSGMAIKKIERDGDGVRKTKYKNGAKIKVNDDGSRKIRLADGTKIKIDKNGKRTVKKF